jgi:hypothetical protein
MLLVDFVVKQGIQWVFEGTTIAWLLFLGST